jgi:hypothetical protein
MTTQKLIGPATLTGALLVGLFSNQVLAADELIVYGTETPTVVGEGQRQFRENVDEYIRSFNKQLRATIEADLKRQLAPKVELAASVAAPTRG